MITLLLREDDISKLTALSGNIDSDAIVPFIATAQKNEIRRILGMDLYNVIVDKFDNDTLSGHYLTIYEEFVVDMLVYYAAGDYIQLGSYKINNGGIFKATAEGGTSVDINEINALATNYKRLGDAVELVFKEYMSTISIPEFKKCDDDSNFGFPWY